MKYFTTIINNYRGQHKKADITALVLNFKFIKIFLRVIIDHMSALGYTTCNVS